MLLRLMLNICCFSTSQLVNVCPLTVPIKCLSLYIVSHKAKAKVKPEMLWFSGKTWHDKGSGVMVYCMYIYSYWYL